MQSCEPRSQYGTTGYTPVGRRAGTAHSPGFVTPSKKRSTIMFNSGQPCSTRVVATALTSHLSPHVAPSISVLTFRARRRSIGSSTKRGGSMRTTGPWTWFSLHKSSSTSTIRRHILREAHRVLQANGILILSTHGYWRYHPHPKDLWRWTAQGLRTQIEEGGFEVLRVRGVLNVGAAGLQLFQDYLISRVPVRLGAITAIVMQRLVGLVDQIPDRAGEKNDDAVVFVIVARRSKR
jgi:hypothetical protein